MKKPSGFSQLEKSSPQPEQKAILAPGTPNGLQRTQENFLNFVFKVAETRLPRISLPVVSDNTKDYIAILSEIEPELIRQSGWSLTPPFADRFFNAQDLGMLIRWSRELAPIFQRLESNRLSPQILSRPSLRFRDFDREVVESILMIGFSSSLIDKRLRAERPQRLGPTQQMAHAWCLLLGSAHPVEHTRALIEMFADAMIAASEQKRAKARLHGKCPTLSRVISALVTYLCRCQECQIQFPTSAALYRYVGEIIKVVTTPSCPACERPHPFSKWQSIREWDKYKGKWAARDERVKAAHLSLERGRTR